MDRQLTQYGYILHYNIMDSPVGWSIPLTLLLLSERGRHLMHSHLSVAPPRDDDDHHTAAIAHPVQATGNLIWTCIFLRRDAVH